MVKKARKISTKCIEQTREYFMEFLDETDFPDPDCTGERGPKFQYPEWLIVFIAVLSVKLKIKQIYKERSYRVEPMQGIVKDIFDLDRCWMRGNSNNRWLFAAMGVAFQMHQLTAFKEKRSTWQIKAEVLG